MALSHKAKRGWALVLLLVWLPLYIIVAIGVLALVGSMNFWVQLLVYAFLGIAWALPFKPVFTGIGRADPETEEEEQDGSSG